MCKRITTFPKVCVISRMIVEMFRLSPFLVALDVGLKSNFIKISQTLPPVDSCTNIRKRESERVSE